MAADNMSGELGKVAGRAARKPYLPVPPPARNAAAAEHSPPRRMSRAAKSVTAADNMSGDGGAQVRRTPAALER